MPEGEEMFKYHGYSGACPKPPLPRQPVKTHEDRANALRDEMCRLASWSRTPPEVAQALMMAVHADNGLLDEIAKGKGN
jgi:hypothetical protein